MSLVSYTFVRTYSDVMASTLKYTAFQIWRFECSKLHVYCFHRPKTLHSSVHTQYPTIYHPISSWRIFARQDERFRKRARHVPEEYEATPIDTIRQA